ncbi:ATP-binding cassette domain-containing protein [Glycomyces sp. TRM65418]|uniref:ABC transporter ATP-binding protein n=1 Tax=Glycomyces sp. TRM65418 TaxID=2867006 RepID=UPI001CE54D43|nr:ATP-binding cassette domain-containing protein [Glycomyces sp. TRM65418]MCC3762524.1 ATP-binding cassette domain-containing protein [Glycomyces sp. TRM65418]QZD56567.1 ATP-binding cassette domain-containing protein [Glycomyces sp. TRM65418]
MLEIKDLHKRFGDTVALDGVSLSAAPGEVVGFVGANGAGKTTTMRIAMGVLAADSGEIVYNGAPLGVKQRRRFGYMPSERGLYPKMKTGEQIAYFGELHGMSRAEAKRSAAELLEQLNLTDRAGDFVQDLSLGNQQRVQLAVSLVHDPEALILDEPFSGLDPIAVDVMGTALRDRAAAGAPVIFSSHQLDLIERLCDSVAIIGNGRIIAAGRVDELKAKEVKQLRVSVQTPEDLTAALPGTVTRDGDDYLVEDADDQEVLRIAAAAGRVTRFAYDQPTIAEIFREAVTR